MGLYFKKMRKVYLVGLIVLGIVSSLHNVDCCKTRRARRHYKVTPTLKDKEKASHVDLHYNNANIPDVNSLEADHVNTLSDLMKGITLETSRKIKRNTPDFHNVPPRHDNEDSKKNQTTPQTLIATLADHNTDALSNNRKTKRANNLRLPRDKKYMCVCEETKCSVKDCLKNEIQKSPNSAEDTAAEVFDDDANSIPKSNNEPKKFNIPFAHNVNFDQRVILGSDKDKPLPPYPVYANPQVYQYAPNPLAHPGLIYSPVTPQQQNYAPGAAYNQFPSPSPIPAHLLKLFQNGLHNLLPVHNNGPKQQYVPSYSSENKNDAESGKVTTPRQIDNGLYPQNKPYGTDYPYYNQPYYTTEVVRADQLDFIKKKPKQLQFGDPTTTNYAPSYYTTKRSPQYDYNKPYGYPSQTEPTSDELSIEVDKVINGYKNNAPTMSVPNDSDLPAYTPPQTTVRPYAPASESRPYSPLAQNQVAARPYDNAPPSDSRPYDSPQTQPTVRPYDRAPDNAPFSDLKAYNPPQAQPTMRPYDQAPNNAPFSDLRPYNSPQNQPTVRPYDRAPNNAPFSDLKAYNPPQNQQTVRPYDRLPSDSRPYNQLQSQPAARPYDRQPDFVIQPPASYNIENAYSPADGQSNTEVNVPQRATTLEDVNNGYTSHYNPQKTATLRDANHFRVGAELSVPNSMENLFRGLEKILLNNVTVSDAPQAQAVDDRPSTTYENNYQNPDTAVVQNAVKKVLNNFVPGKSEDLLANYGTEHSPELARENAESLSPDLTSTQQVLRNLLNVPEVENMIIETTNNLINQVVGTSVPENVIKDTLRNVVNEIPPPTTPPPKRSAFKFNIRLNKRVPRYDESMDREVFEKIKSIIDKSELGEEGARHPLAQNLIVKTVKHSLDKEKGVADEAAIRRAFNQLMKSRRPSDNAGNGLIVQPTGSYDNGAAQDKTVYTTEDTGYKLAPAVPVKERRLQGGVWVETPKNLVGNRVPPKSPMDEKRRKELEKQLDMLQKYNQPNATAETPVGSPYTQKSDVTTREAGSNHYNGNAVTTDPKNVQYNYPQGNGYTSLPVVTTINYDVRNPSYPATQQPINYDYRNPSYSATQQPINYDYRNTATQQPNNNNQLNMLVESTQPTADQKAEGEPYMGRLVPVNAVNGDADSSNLVWVGDGVKLPLTMRKMPDGSYALTLSDEVCKMFVHKKCPCCLPDGGQGMIVRERRNGDEDNTISRQHLTGNYRVRRDSSESTTTTRVKTISNAIGKHNDDDFEDADYDSSEENSIQRGAPYKYQRYADQDRIIKGRTRALGNMLKWMKDIVTEAHEKRQRKKSEDKHKVALF